MKFESSPSRQIRRTAFTGLSGIVLKQLLPSIVLVQLISGWYLGHARTSATFDVKWEIAFQILTLMLIIALILIVARKLDRAEAALERGEANFKSVFDFATVGIGQVNPKTGAFLNANAKFQEITGYSLEELRGISFAKLTHPEDRERDSFGFSAMLRGETPVYRTEKRYVRKDNRVVWVRLEAGVAERDVNGRPLRTIATIQEITEERRAAEALAESEAKFRTLADVIPQLVWILSPEGDLEYANQRLIAFARTPFAQVQGKGWIQFVHPDDRERAMQTLSQANRLKRALQDESRLLNGTTGAYEWFLLRAVPIFDEHGKLLKWFGTHTQIEERKELESKLNSALRSRDEFISVASHELKTPLTSLKLQVQAFRRGITKSKDTPLTQENMDRLFGQMEKEVDRISHLVNDMLDVSRIETGRLKIERQDVDLCEIVVDLLERLRLELTQATGELPKFKCVSVRGRWDPFRIEQVMVNLLTNAMRYGGGKPIEIWLEQHERFARFAVKDHGVGIAKENHERIFERFQRADSGREVVGLGLGLFISRQIVDLHGGKIWIESELGKGSTFYVDLPFDS